MNVPTPEKLERIAVAYAAIKSEISRVIVGQDAVIHQILTALLSRGHCLLLGVPGLAKTLIVRSLGEALDLSFNRVQFTPDLMPSDITGTEILDEESGSTRRSLRFVPGPIFTNLLLADGESTARRPRHRPRCSKRCRRTSSLPARPLHPAPQPFFVLATQNPIEQEGTYPLPEAQLDRFMFLILMDYPERAEEMQILRQTTINRDINLTRRVDGATLLDLQRCVRDIPVSEHVLGYCIDLVRNTRPAEATAPDFVRANLAYGAGPRAGQYLVLAAKATAALEGRLNVCCADVRRNAHAVAPPDRL